MEFEKSVCKKNKKRLIGRQGGVTPKRDEGITIFQQQRGL